MVTQSEQSPAAHARHTEPVERAATGETQSSPENKSTGAAWRLAGWQIALGVAIVTLAYWNTALSMVEVWAHSETFNHGFLILPIACYLAWLRYPRQQDKAPEGSWLGLGVIGLGAAAWWLGDAAGVQLVAHFAFVVMLQGVLLAGLGWRCYKAMLFPALYLFLMVPFGEFAVLPLQDLTAEYTVMLARASGIPVFIDGLYIDIPGGSFLVAEACSGVRYLIATFALGLLVQDLLFVSRWRKALILVLSLVIPIIANVIRAYLILTIAYVSDFEIAVGVDHILYGWVFFAVVTLALIAIAFRFREPPAPLPEAQPAPETPRRNPLRSAAPLAASLLLAVVVPVSNAVSGPPAAPVATLEIPLPEVGQSWQQADADASEWSGIYPHADASLLTRFEGAEGAVDLFVASYAWERPKAELINFQNNMIGGRRWDIVGVAKGSALFEDREQALVALKIKRGQHERLIWYFYRVDGEQTADPRFAKLLKVKAKLMNGYSPASVIAVSTPIGDGTTADASERLATFLSELRMGDALDETLADFAARERTTQRLADKGN